MDRKHGPSNGWSKGVLFVLTIDFETRSRVDLRKCGTSVYARHPSTEILCLAWQNKLGETFLWTPKDPKPEPLLDAILWGEPVEAHNAFFERNIWRWICHERFGWPDVPFEKWRCTLARCSRVALPRGLGDAGAALGLPIQKDDAGHKVMMRLAKPKTPSKADPGEWDNDPTKFRKLYAYCKQDVESEVAISQAVRTLPAAELKLWQLDQRINLRGLQVDRFGLIQALAIVDAVYEDCCQELNRITKGKVGAPKQVSSMLSWINERVEKEIPDLAIATVDEFLSGDLPTDVRRVLEIRKTAAKASTAKLNAMLERCDQDGRVRGNLVYHGAATGRWSGAGIQIQNFPRGSLSKSEIELVHRLLPAQSGRAIDLLLGPPIDCISSSLRSFIVAAPGHRLMACDFASIEARVLAWIAGQEDLLQGFREGQDVYKAMASKIYSIEPGDVSKPQRQIGKVAILGLGYGMGHKAFRDACLAMAGVSIDSLFSKQVVKAYREANPRIKELWASLNTACVRAIETQKPHRVGRLEITCDDSWMRIVLPSRRDLHYRSPSLVEVRAPWSEGYEGKIHGNESLRTKLEELDIELGAYIGGSFHDCTVPNAAYRVLKASKLQFHLTPKEPQFIKQIQYWGVNSVSRKWSKIRTYGASLVENLVQAIARDFLAEAMIRVEKAGYPIVATVHDEIVCEVPNGKGSLGELERLMAVVPGWGNGCPLSVEGFENERYGK